MSDLRVTPSRVVFRDTDYRYGFHCQKFPTYVKTVEEVALNSPYSAFQIYVSNGRSYANPEYNIRDILKANKLLKYHDLHLYIHGRLLHNLCGSSTVLQHTIDGLLAETDIAVSLGGKGVIVHPNSCEDVEQGLATASKTIEIVLTTNTPSSKELSKSLGITQTEFKRRRCVILENCAREGNKRGGTLEELSTMIKGVDESVRDQVGVCIDTAHAFGAGLYDWGKPSEIKRFYKDFDKIIGLKYLKVFHLNDSRESTKKADNAYFGSKKDRHENLGIGWIFSDDINPLIPPLSRRDGLRDFFLEAREHGVAVIGEPPAKSKDGVVGCYPRRDWETVCRILEGTEFPLEESITF